MCQNLVYLNVFKYIQYNEGNVQFWGGLSADWMIFLISDTECCRVLIDTSDGGWWSLCGGCYVGWRVWLLFCLRSLFTDEHHSNLEEMSDWLKSRISTWKTKRCCQNNDFNQIHGLEKEKRETWVEISAVGFRAVICILETLSSRVHVVE